MDLVCTVHPRPVPCNTLCDQTWIGHADSRKLHDANSCLTACPACHTTHTPWTLSCALTPPQNHQSYRHMKIERAFSVIAWCFVDLCVAFFISVLLCLFLPFWLCCFVGFWVDLLVVGSWEPLGLIFGRCWTSSWEPNCFSGQVGSKLNTFWMG